MKKILTTLSIFSGLATLLPLPAFAADSQIDVVCSFSHMNPMILL
jgi:hypothetical protein